MDPWDFIQTVARDLGASAEAVRKWRIRGVPGRYHLAIVERAKRDGVKFDAAALGQPPGSRREAAALSTAA